MEKVRISDLIHSLVCKITLPLPISKQVWTPAVYPVKNCKYVKLKLINKKIKWSLFVLVCLFRSFMSGQIFNDIVSNWSTGLSHRLSWAIIDLFIYPKDKIKERTLG